MGNMGSRVLRLERAAKKACNRDERVRLRRMESASPWKYDKIVEIMYMRANVACLELHHYRLWIYSK
jgi:hypothetical protein